MGSITANRINGVSKIFSNTTITTLHLRFLNYMFITKFIQKMQKIAIKELVDFRQKSTDNGKKNFAYKLKNRIVKEKPKDDENSNGGDYWISSTSCIQNVFKHNKNGFYETKINELTAKRESNEDKKAKSMYQRNIDILNNFKDFNFDDVRPTKILKFVTVQKVHKVINVNDFPLYLNPSLLFSHERNGKNELGAIWLVAQIHGFKKNELGMFCEILHDFLIKNYSNDYQVSDDLCVAIDTVSAQKVIYQELIKGEIPFLIQKTLEEIKKLN